MATQPILALLLFLSSQGKIFESGKKDLHVSNDVWLGIFRLVSTIPSYIGGESQTVGSRSGHSGNFQIFYFWLCT